MILKITAMVKPRIWNGNRISQKKNRKKNNPIASGQHMLNRMQKSKIAIKNFIMFPFCAFSGLKIQTKNITP